MTLGRLDPGPPILIVPDMGWEYILPGIALDLVAIRLARQTRRDERGVKVLGIGRHVFIHALHLRPEAKGRQGAGAEPCGEIDVHQFVESIRLAPRQTALGQHEAIVPGLMSFLHGPVTDVHLGFLGGDDLDRLPAGGDQNLFRGQQIKAIAEAIPEGTELALLLLRDRELGGASI